MHWIIISTLPSPFISDTTGVEYKVAHTELIGTDTGQPGIM